MPPERYVEILADLKPTFIHHPRAKELIAGLLAELGCDIERTYFDVPRLRTMAHGEYLNAGLAYQFHPHRDTWFSAPHQQLNWWLPVYEIEAENSMAFHPQYFDTPMRNSSAGYDYEEWNKTGRKQAATQVKKETRKQPQPEEPLELAPDVRVVTPPGGVLVFSAAQLHSTVPNTTSSHTLQHRLPHREPRRPDRGRRGAERRLGVHGDDAARLRACQRPRAAPRGRRRDLRQEPGDGRRLRLIMRHGPFLIPPWNPTRHRSIKDARPSAVASTRRRGPSGSSFSLCLPPRLAERGAQRAGRARRRRTPSTRAPGRTVADASGNGNTERSTGRRGRRRRSSAAPSRSTGRQRLRRPRQPG